MILSDFLSREKHDDSNPNNIKQVTKQIITPQTLILPEAKIISHIKPRIGQGRAGIKRKTLKFPVSQPYNKPEQTKLLPGRKPIIQIAERTPFATFSKYYTV